MYSEGTHITTRNYSGTIEKAYPSDGTYWLRLDAPRTDHSARYADRPGTPVTYDHVRVYHAEVTSVG